MKNFNFFYCIFLLVLGSQFPSGAQNLALKKKYQLSIAPNYNLSGNDEGSLTDGFFTDEIRFWQLTSTVGWQYQNEVVVNIDLEKEGNIGEITFNTARGQSADVYYPKHIFAFLSNNGRDYFYAGDLADDDQNQKGTYQVRRFKLKNIGVNARYVKLVVVATGKYIFTDEIEVIRGKGSGNNIKHQVVVNRDDLGMAVDSLIQSSNKLRELRGSEFYGMLAGNPSIQNNGTDSRALELLMKRSRLAATTAQFDSPFIVEQVDPWGDMDMHVVPKADKASLEFRFSMLHNGVQYGGILITNNTEEDLWLDIRSNESGPAVEFFQAPTIASRNRAYLVDPLVPITEGKCHIAFGSNALLVFQVKGNVLGRSQANVSIMSDQKKVDLNISTNVLPADPSAIDQLNVNTWAYLDYPSLRNRKEEAVRDLTCHHNNTTVVHSSFIPRIGNNNFTKLKEYVSYFPSANKVFLFTNFRNKPRRDVSSTVEFMSPQWKMEFTKWYAEMLLAMEEAGFSADKVYWYPYDEIEAEEVNDFIEFAKWAKKNVPKIQLYMTILYEETLDVVSYTDIAQLHMPLLYRSSIPASNAELWSYEAIPNAREHPVSEYRLMGWRAYYYGMKGIGFWNYADVGRLNENLITSNAHNLERDYAVIYISPKGDIVSSRRWEAFKLGIEDYQLLLCHENIFGRKATLKLIRNLVSLDEDNPQIDLMRNRLISNIFQDE